MGYFSGTREYYKGTGGTNVVFGWYNRVLAGTRGYYGTQGVFGRILRSTYGKRECYGRHSNGYSAEHSEGTEMILRGVVSGLSRRLGALAHTHASPLTPRTHF
jgi:hypothetical protein